METREVTQVLVYKLMLNPILGKGDVAEIAAVSYDEDKLQDWMEFLKEKEMYKDAGYYKHFRKGSALEMYNPWLGTKFGVFKEWIIQSDFDKWRELHDNIPFVE